MSPVEQEARDWVYACSEELYLIADMARAKGEHDIVVVVDMAVRQITVLPRLRVVDREGFHCAKEPAWECEPKLPPASCFWLVYITECDEIADMRVGFLQLSRGGDA